MTRHANPAGASDHPLGGLGFANWAVEVAEHGVRWESTGEGSYTVETVHRDARGTDVVLHLRPDEDELLGRVLEAPLELEP